MANKNDSESAAAGMIFAGLGMIAIFLFVFAALLSIALTIVSLFAWNKERRLFGQTITPDEARVFIGCGIVGAVVFALSGLYLCAQGSPLEESRAWMPFVGYIIGSIGGGGAYAHHKEEEQKRAEQEARAIVLQSAPLQHKPPLREQPQRPFEYASWDDEEPRA